MLNTFRGKLPFLDTFEVVSRIPTILKHNKPPISYIKAIMSSFSNDKTFENFNFTNMKTF